MMYSLPLKESCQIATGEYLKRQITIHVMVSNLRGITTGQPDNAPKRVSRPQRSRRTSMVLVADWAARFSMVHKLEQC